MMSCAWTLQLPSLCSWEDWEEEEGEGGMREMCEDGEGVEMVRCIKQQEEEERRESSLCGLNICLSLSELCTHKLLPVELQ